MKVLFALPLAWAIAGAPIAQTPVTPRESPGAPPIAIHLPALTASLDLLGGRLVRVRDLRVGDSVSAQAFVVRAPDWRESRALVLLSRTPAREFVDGIAIEVQGRAYTLAGASVAVGWPAELDSDAVRAFAGVPVIAAEVIRTIDGVELYRQAP